MNHIEIIESIYHAYFSNEEHNMFDFRLDTDFIYAVQKIMVLSGMNSKEISDYVHQRFDGMLSSEDPNIVNKLTLHLRFPLYISLQRCLILFETKDRFDGIDFNLNFFEFSTISHLIIFRILLYNIYHYFLINELMDEELESAFNEVFHKKLSIWFTAEELAMLNSDIDLNLIQKYLDFYSIEVENIKSNIDPFKIIKCELGCTVIFLHDYSYNLYQTMEDNFIQSFHGDSKLSSSYGKLRGEMFEKYTYMLLKDFISVDKIHKNYFYKDIDGKTSELDFIVEFSDVVLNIECKSAKFDTFLADSGKVLNDRFISAYKRSYDSIDRFQRTVNNRTNLTLKKEGSSKLIDLKNKEVVSIHLTAYDMKYIASEIQRDIIPSMEKYEFYPININCIDFQCMLLDIGFGGFGDKRISAYFKKRFKIINTIKGLKFDMDEMDVYGFITSQSEENQKTLKLFEENSNSTIDFLISNGIFRNQLNKELSSMFLDNRIEDFTSANLHDFLKTLLIH